METIQLNIQNLTSLWKSATQPFNTYNEDEQLGYCFVPKSQWPNKIWLKKEYNLNILNEIQLLLNSDVASFTFSYFDANSNVDHQIFNDHGLTEASIQFGMSLKLTQKVTISKPLKFHLVTNASEAKDWSQTFQKAFGYHISEQTLKKTYHQINYYLIYDQDELVGTVIVHQTQKTLGIHSLGIVPTMRGKAYATQIMYNLINKGIEQKCHLATLQASQMAKSMYEKMGFTTQFIMRNYKLKTE